MQSSLYPKGPDHVPADLTSPSKSFTKHIWFAMAALVLFMVIYIGLSSWFLYKSFKLFANVFSGGNDSFLNFITAAFLGFLGIFMVKALFFRTRNNNDHAIEIQPEDEPELFAFVNRVADEAKAPRPHKIFISNVVNASVSYDISVFNLIFPTKKNLEIGLGLVNTLNLGEFKSIVAHEFGHFAQKSMLIGRWVYVAHRVAHHMIAKRDAFDSFLNGLSRVDIRIAWVGWILSVIVWSIRSISHTLFSLVLLTERALSREMEFHADLVAVSLTGSDAIVNSLYKLQSADEAYDNALDFVNKQLGHNKAVSNIYAIQTNAIKHMAVVLNNPAYGVSPKPEEAGDNRAAFRVFKEQIAQAPKMWRTHPSNIDREKNAKANYIKTEADERSPWLLFKNAEATKTRVTNLLYRNLKIETTPLSDEESITLHDQEFRRSFMLPKYRGVYLSRPLFLDYTYVEDTYDMQTEMHELDQKFTELYHDSLQEHLTTLKKLEEEIALLEGINNKTLNATQGKKINYRNSQISRKDLPVAIAQAKREAKTEQDKIDGHNHLCRNVHYAAAQKMGKGWPEYLLSVARLVHYCEHNRKNIEVLTQYYYEVLDVTLKTKNRSESDILYLLNVANSLYSAIEPVYNKSVEIEVGQAIIDKMGGKKLEDHLEPLKLGAPRMDNINTWVGVVGGWVDLAIKGLTVMHEAALDELLLTEEYIKESYASTFPVKEAPEPIVIEEDYKKYNPNQKRTVNKKPDLFSRFYHGEGLGFTIARAGVAASVIFLAIFMSMSVGRNKIVIYNGLPIDVKVRLDDHEVLVPYEERYETEVGSGSVDIQTTTTDGEPIESFTAEMPNSSKNYVYNVANAGVMYTYSVTYGTSALYGINSSNDFSMLGNPRWTEITADYYFREPPETIRMKSGSSATRSVLGVFKGHPTEMAAALQAEGDLAAFVKSHAIHQKEDSPYILSWLGLAGVFSPDFKEIIQKRLDKNPLELVSLRAEQDFSTGDEKKKVCDKHIRLAASNPDNVNLQYLKCRCMPDGPDQDNAFVEGHDKWKDNPWFAFAASSAFIRRERWNDALACFTFVGEKAPYLKEAVAEEQKRICQFLGQDSLAPYWEEGNIPYLRQVHRAEISEENGNSDSDYSYAYKLLHEGNVNEALKYCKPDTDVYAKILRLAAVSDGADEQTINQALALDVSGGLGSATFVPTLALQIKNKLPVDTYKEALKSNIGDVADTVFTFINLVKAHRIGDADKLLNTLSTEMKGKFALLGILISEDTIPGRWNTYAPGFLFITEKPYLKRFPQSSFLTVATQEDLFGTE